MRTSIRSFPWMLLGALLFCACTNNRGLRIQDASPAPGPEAGGATRDGWDLGADASSNPDAPTDGAAPTPDLRAQTCGNGRLDRGEQCDDGNTLSGDGCSSLCQLEDDPPCIGGKCVAKPVCGNGMLSTNEVCDDGNRVSGDGCTADCLAVEPGWRCRAPSRPCVPLCGDRVLRGSETCDDGNTLDGDGCSVYCLTEPGWDCSGGVCVAISSLDGGMLDGGIDAGAATPYCGDGIVSGAEECDEGASNDDDTYGGCTTRCFFGPFCGDALVNGSEECDLGEQNGAVLGKGGCTAGCTNAHYCGDGLVDLYEECDLGDRNGVKLDSNLQPTDDPASIVYCTADCAIPSCCVL